jgi:hypothetical protein
MLCAIVGLLLGPTAPRAWADSGLLRLHERSGPYEISVFTSPTPLQDLMVDVSVFVQEAATGENVNDVHVTIRLKLRGTEETMTQEASRSLSTNKLYQSSLFWLSDFGWWDVEVIVTGPQGEGRGKFEMEATRPPPRWVTMWRWYTWPVVPLVLMFLFVWVKARKGSRAASRPPADRPPRQEDPTTQDEQDTHSGAQKGS